MVHVLFKINYFIMFKSCYTIPLNFAGYDYLSFPSDYVQAGARPFIRSITGLPGFPEFTAGKDAFKNGQDEVPQTG